uniref:Uncharacterized protein n=1 Tax=Oryza sativa subsp. japonica TaxID=39947 RepID=Q6Z0N0_ORYSJ|nr:hypothetical protein [Oryza sativa Japonica Group]
MAPLFLPLCQCHPLNGGGDGDSSTFSADDYSSPPPREVMIFPEIRLFNGILGYVRRCGRDAGGFVVAVPGREAIAGGGTRFQWRFDGTSRTKQGASEIDDMSVQDLV